MCIKNGILHRLHSRGVLCVLIGGNLDYALVQKMQEKEIRWKTTLFLFSIYLCFFLFLTSCNDPKNSGIPEMPIDTSNITPGDISDRLVARIYFDSTLSMQGFVVPGSTRYTRICPSLERVIVSGWRDETVSFFRFGERVESIDRSTYLQVGSVDFYEDENIYRETFIQKIIDYEDQMRAGNTSEALAETEVSGTPAESTEVVTPTEEVNESREEGELVVIVTDLFQDRGDINLLVAQLKDKYIKDGIEVGLLGLRSKFDGTVYDTGIGQAPLPYRSEPNNPETFRPFYLLVLGRHADIAHYFDRLIERGFPEAKTIIFSQYLVKRLVSFADATTIKAENLNSRTSVHSEEPHLKEYEIVKDRKPAKISVVKLKYEPLPHAMFFDSDTLEPSITAKHAPMGESIPSPDAERCLEVTSTLLENELTVKFNLERSLPRQAVYLYKVTLQPAIDTYKVPEWCSGWDMGSERNGAKTLNLVNFVRGLTETTVRDHLPKIAQFYFYIKKR